MMTETVRRSRGRGALESVMASKAPAQPATGAALGRRVGSQGVAKLAVSGAVPDLPQGLLGGITKGVVAVALLREWRDAAGQRTAVGRDVHDRPGTPAEGPGACVILARQALSGLGGARGVEAN